MPNFPFMPPPALQLPSQVVRHAEGNHVQGPSFADLNLLSGKKAIEQSGLVPSHVAAMQTIASRFNLILMFRPVNRLSTGLLAEGGVAKGMHIKAKTSDWGPMAGLIPADQALSKKWQGLLKQPPQAPLQAQLTESANTSVFPRPLMLSADRLEFLASSDIALIRLPSGWQSAVAKGPCSIEINGKQGVDDQPGKYYKFRLLDSGNGQYGVEYAPTEHHPAGGSGWKTLQVLHAYIGMEPMTEQNLQDDYNFGPITADYDAFAYLPHARSPLLPAFSGMAAPAQAESSDPPVKRSTAGLWKKAVEHLQQHHL
ncbi:MAG TPA: anthrax toxin-like adenylyl cyclase domain-containing protein, partial [Limnobacter sp.]|nr:anthrax toxin-like adenylyl cyclase domain-containing protein [Limnobacter sp.]